jgi:hypothetical protein
LEHRCFGRAHRRALDASPAVFPRGAPGGGPESLPLRMAAQRRPWSMASAPFFGPPAPLIQPGRFWRLAGASRAGPARPKACHITIRKRLSNKTPARRRAEETPLFSERRGRPAKRGAAIFSARQPTKCRSAAALPPRRGLKASPFIIVIRLLFSHTCCCIRHKLPPWAPVEIPSLPGGRQTEPS